MVLVKCQVCEKEFNCPPSHIKRGQGKYCSRECSYIGRSKKTTTTCLYCGKIFETPIYYLKRGQMKYCSHKCWYSTIKNEGNPAYKHGNKSGYHFSHKLHYNMPCFACGTFQDVHTHHMDEDHTNNIYSNFEWLCRSCHSRYHRLKENHSISVINQD